MTEREYAGDFIEQRSSWSLAQETPAEAPHEHTTEYAELASPWQAPLVQHLLDVAANLVAAPHYDTLLEQIVVQTVEALPPIQAGMLWLYDPRIGRLSLTEFHHLPLNADMLILTGHRQISPGVGLIGQAFEHRELVLAGAECGYAHLVQHQPEEYHYEQPDTDPLPPTPGIFLCLPLCTADQTVGVLVLLGPQQDTAEEESHSALSYEQEQELRQALPGFGRLIGNTIASKRLYHEAQNHRSRLDAFDAVVTAISTATDLSDMLHSVLDIIVEIVHVSAGAIFLLNPNQGRLVLGAELNLPDDYRSTIQDFAIVGAACEEVVRYGQPAVRPLIEDRGETALLSHGLESCAYLPLLAGGTVVGTLALYDNAGLYKDLDITKLMPLCNQVGFAIANVRLYRDSYLERYKLTTVINSIAEGVVMCDAEGRLLLANEAAMSLLSLDQVPVAQTLSEMPDFYGIRDLEETPLPVEQLPLSLALSGATFHDYRVLLCGISGENSVMSFSGAPVRADHHTIEGAVVVFRDITARQRLERAKDEFLAVTAHELRSPLAAVRGYAEMLLQRERQRTEGESRELRGLTVLSQQVTHMLSMVDNLLDVSRLDAGLLDLQRQPTNLISLVQQVLEQQEPTASGYELRLETSLSELWMQCDSLRIRQVLTNLVSNAIKYSRPETCVSVRISQSADSSIGPEASGEVLVCVSDQGTGIPADKQAKLFERYYRIKGQRAEGLGLGLYLSRQFVLMHGGRIWVESKEGQGSTFCFGLPMQPAPEEIASDAI